MREEYVTTREIAPDDVAARKVVGQGGANGLSPCLCRLHVIADQIGKAFGEGDAHSAVEVELRLAR